MDLQAGQTSRDSAGDMENPIGVAIVTYNASDVIAGCLDSLLESEHPNLRIVICDNASPDATLDTIRDWAGRRGCDLFETVPGGVSAQGGAGRPGVTLLRPGVNAGFAAGVNHCLRALLAQPDIGLFWILNPDCIVTPQAASAYAGAAARAGRFSLMGGRTLYLEPPNRIQSEGGRVNRWTGICSSINHGLPAGQGETPDPGTLDFIAGANLVASREFIETAGLMNEDYFLYYEEVDWAFRRGNLPLRMCYDAVVYHHGGTSIGSGSLSRLASGFANYFNYRNRMWFMQRHFPAAYPVAYVYSLLKVVKLLMLGAREEAGGALRGLNRMAPPQAVRTRLGPEANRRAFGKKSA